MPNYIPIMGTPDAAGGYLIRPEYGQVLVDAVAAESALGQFVSVERTKTRKRKYTRLVGRPTASFVGEGADIPATGAEFGEIEVNVKKIGTTILYTEEELEDAEEDPQALVNSQVETAFAQLIDAHALGMGAGVPLTTQFDNSFNAGVKSKRIELGTAGDAWPTAVSDAMGYIEDNGGTPNGVIAATDLRKYLRDQRRETEKTEPALTDGFSKATPDTYDLPHGYTTNLDGFPAGEVGAGEAKQGKVVAVVGDFTHAKYILRQDIRIKLADQATVNVGGTDHRTWQQDKIAIKWTMRVGFNVHQVDGLFAVILNKS
jgi:hypothetical protein